MVYKKVQFKISANIKHKGRNMTNVYNHCPMCRYNYDSYERTELKSICLNEVLRNRQNQ